MHSRRIVLQDLAIAVPMLAAWRTGALAAAGKDALDAWARNVAALNCGLAEGTVGLTAWQDHIATLSASVPVSDVVRYLDIDALPAYFVYPSKLAETADLHFPNIDPAQKPEGDGLIRAPVISFEQAAKKFAS